MTYLHFNMLKRGRTDVFFCKSKLNLGSWKNSPRPRSSLGNLHFKEGTVLIARQLLLRFSVKNLFQWKSRVILHPDFWGGGSGPEIWHCAFCTHHGKGITQKHPQPHEQEKTILCSSHIFINHVQSVSEWLLVLWIFNFRHFRLQIVNGYIGFLLWGKCSSRLFIKKYSHKTRFVCFEDFK